MIKGDDINLQPSDVVTVNDPIYGNKTYDKCLAQIVFSDYYNQSGLNEDYLNDFSIDFEGITLQFSTKNSLPCLDRITPSNLSVFQNMTLSDKMIHINDQKFISIQNGLLAKNISSLGVGLKMKRCVKGEYFNLENLQCIPCNPNFFSFSDEFLQASSCTNCLSQNFYCYGGFNITPKAGFWRRGYRSTNFIKCVNPEGIYMYIYLYYKKKDIHIVLLGMSTRVINNFR